MGAYSEIRAPRSVILCLCLFLLSTAPLGASLSASSSSPTSPTKPTSTTEIKTTGSTTSINTTTPEATTNTSTMITIKQTNTTTVEATTDTSIPTTSTTTTTLTTKTTPQQVGFNESCDEEGPSTQCMTTNATCIERKCSCEPENLVYNNGSCVQKCESLPKINSNVTYLGNTDESSNVQGTVANITCYSGYRVDNMKVATRICNNGNWNGSANCTLKEVGFNESCDEEGPSTQCMTTNATCIDGKCSCEPENLVYNNGSCVQKCESLPKINSNVTYLGNTDESSNVQGTVANITCYPGYRVDNMRAATRICNNGNWNGSANCTLKEVGFNESCDEEGPSTQCMTTNANCIDGKCRCEPENLVYNNGSCVQRQAPGLTPIYRSTDALKLQIRRGNEPGTSFNVCRTSNICKDVTGENLTVYFDSLSAGHCYNFSVKIKDDPNSATGILTNCTRPDQPERPTVEHKSNHTLTVLWQYNNEYDHHFVVSWRKNSEPMTWDSTKESDSNYTIVNLTAATEYYINITVMQHGVSSLGTVLTACTDPNIPRNCSVKDRTDHNVTLQWQEPDGSFDFFEVNETKVNKNDSYSYTPTDVPLSAGHTYLYSIKTGLDCNNSRSLSCDVCVTTLPPNPSDLQIQNSTNTSVSVTWSHEDGNVSGFQVVLNNGTGRRDFPNVNRTISITDLTPGSRYTVTVMSVQNDTCPEAKKLFSASNVSTVFFTRPNTPGVGFQFTMVNISGFTVAWLNDTSYSQSYVAIVNETDGEVNITTNNSWASFYILEPGTLYTILLYSVVNHNLHSEQPAVASNYTQPARPDFLYLDNIQFENITVRMSATNARFQWWHVALLSADKSTPVQNASYNRTIKSATITGLSPGTEYWIQFYTTVPGQQSKINETSFYTKTPGVDPKSIRVVNTTSTSISIEWSPPSVNHTSILSYNVTFHCTSPNNPGAINLTSLPVQNTSATVTGLDPGTSCTVQLQTDVGNQTSVTAKKTLEETTNETAPESVPYVTIEAINATSIAVNWQEPEVRNGIIRRYYLLVPEYKADTCEPGDPNNASLVQCMRRVAFVCTDCKNATASSHEGSVGNVCQNKTVDYVSANTTFSYTISDLHPYMSYRISVIPYTFTSGPNTSNVTTTLESSPSGAPQHTCATVVDASSVSVLWAPPACGSRNGNITNYNILYTFFNHTCVDELSESTLELETSVSDELNTTLTGLYEYWGYNVSVRAATAQGPGNYSQRIHLKTESSLPGRVRDVQVDNTTIYANGFLVTWQQPCYPNGVIVSYTIQVNNTDPSGKYHAYHANTTSINITDLLPFGNYTVAVNAVTKIGAGNLSELIPRRTAVGVPYPPLNVQGGYYNSSAVFVTWEQQLYSYTGPTSYTAFVVGISSFQCSVSGFNSTSCLVTGLTPYTNYTFAVTAVTTAGNTTSNASNIVTTSEAEPGNIVHLEVSTEDDVKKNRSIFMSWMPPAPGDRHGVITGYEIIATNSQCEINCSTDYVGKELNCTPVTVEFYCTSIGNFSDFALNCTLTRGLKTGNYTVRVKARTSVGYGSPIEKLTQVRPGAPLKIPELHGALLVQSGGGAISDPKRQVAVQFPYRFMCDDTNGAPTDWGVIVAESSRATDESFIGQSSSYYSERETKYRTWFQVKGSEKIDPYIASTVDWDPCQVSKGNRKKRSTVGAQIPFVVGESGDCSGVPAGNRCNGELTPGKNYRVKTFVCTAGGCTETRYSDALATEALINAGLIAGVVSAVVVLAGVAVAVFFLRRRQMLCFAKKVDEEVLTHRAEPPTNLSEMKDLTQTNRLYIPGPVKLVDFPDHVDRLYKDSKMIFTEAYKMLREESPSHPMTAAEIQSSRPKNRYTNILPYDHSRVKLLPLDDEEESDYINANYIPGYTSKREYIATQGPLPATFNDFWRMIWEQNVDTIVMLTKLVEKGRPKCDKYWPDLNEPVFYGDLVVCVQSESHLSDYTIRVIEVKLKAARRVVRQFCYLKWPDMGCPDQPTQLLEFVKAVKEYTKANAVNKGPMVVHCSAGVGRTGTFLAVDHLLQYIRDHDHLDIYRLVLDMRNYRCNMVQTEDQFVYIHDCMREFITVDEEEDDEEQEPTYMNVQNDENVYENTAFNADQ